MWGILYYGTSSIEGRIYYFSKEAVAGYGTHFSGWEKNIILYGISSFLKCFLKHGNKTPDLANSASAFITFTAV